MTGAIVADRARRDARRRRRRAGRAVPDRIAEALDIAIPEVQFRGVHADEQGRLTVAAAERLEELVERADAVVFGPGVGDSDQVRALARWAVRTAPRARARRAGHRRVRRRHAGARRARRRADAADAARG